MPDRERARRGDTPARVLELCERVSGVLGESLTIVPARGPHERYCAESDRHFVYLAHDAKGSQRLAREARRRRWAAGRGVAVPEIVELTPEWLVSPRVPSDELVECSGQIIEIAAVIAAGADSPPDDGVYRPGPRRVGAHSFRLYAMLAAGGQSVREYRRLLDAVTKLPHVELQHGDFHRHNLLHDSTHGLVRVIDWERLRLWPRFQDLLSAWPRLPRPGDRAWIIENVETRATDLEAAGVLHLAGVLRVFGREILLRPGRDRIEELRGLVAEARARAKRWRG